MKQKEIYEILVHIFVSNNNVLLPSGRSRPPADVARFFGPSFKSRSELRRDNGAPPLYDTFDIDVERR